MSAEEEERESNEDMEDIEDKPEVEKKEKKKDEVQENKNYQLGGEYYEEKVIENPNLRNFQIYWYYAKGELDMSQMHLDQWKAFTCANFEFGHWIQAMLHRRTGKLNESLRYFKLCHVIDSENPEFLKQIAKTLKLLGRFKTASKVLEDALRKSPDDWELYYLMATIRENQGQLEEAKEYLNKASKYSRNRQVILKFGQLHQIQGENDWASMLLLKFAEKNILDSQVSAELGTIYLDNNKIPEAFHYFGQALAQDPNNDKVLLGLGSICQEYSDGEGALMKYKVFNSEDTNSAEIWNNIGMCYFEREQYISAISCLKKALFLNPMQWIIYFNVGLIYLSMEQYSSSFHYILVSIKFNPKNAQAYMFLGICLKEMSDPANAYNAFNRATQLDPNNHLIFLNFAIFLAESGSDKYEMAKEHFVKHDEIFKSTGTDKNNFEMRAQRNALSKLLGVPI